ncbi:MAG: 2-amino-4-hydroxy-6-hydroxymethyldihydropteridine diphosphokinase [Dehalococcoidia bacterium]|nr:2-amino-4-hydroxy-6-hydroxymethyldihydropteridine diphosphokinase [Dehalococcoidia bacterium]
MVQVLLGLGSNLGDREGNIREALARLGAVMVFEKVSSFYETDPVGYLDQPSFINIVCLGSAELSPMGMLDLVKAIEEQMGREPNFRNGPRLIDIDILSYGDTVLDTEELTIPHPRLAERSFVLAPLSEIGPDWRHPTLAKTASEMAGEVGSRGVRLKGRVAA